MKMLIISLLTLFVAVVIALLAMEDPGYVLIAVDEWTVETTLALAAVIIALSFFTLYYPNDMKCISCNTIVERMCKCEDRKNLTCTICGDVLTPQVTAGRYIPFKSGWYEHIAKEPIYINNKQDLRDACKEHGMGSAYLDDM